MHNPSSDKEFRVEQPLFRGGGTYANWQSAKQRVRAGAYQLQGTEQQVMLQAVTAYMNVVANMAILADARSNADVLDKQVASTSDRFSYGEVTRADVAQAQAGLAEAHAQVASAQGSLVNAVAQFEHIVGYKPPALSSPVVLPEIPGSLEEALDQARRANPQLLEAIHAAQAADYDVRTNESVLLPHVSLVGTLSRQDGIGLLGSDKFNQDQIGLQVSIPLYSRARNTPRSVRRRPSRASRNTTRRTPSSPSRKRSRRHGSNTPPPPSPRPRARSRSRRRRSSSKACAPNPPPASAPSSTCSTPSRRCSARRSTRCRRAENLGLPVALLRPDGASASRRLAACRILVASRQRGFGESLFLLTTSD